MVDLELTLPYPLSANRYWQSFVPRGATRALVHLSTEAKAYRTAMEQAVRGQGVVEPVRGRVAIEIDLFPARPLDWQKRQRVHGAAWDDTVRCIDLDNANKVLLDSLKGVAIEDDVWVRRLVSQRMEPDEHGARVVVRISALHVEQPQASLLGEAA